MSRSNNSPAQSFTVGIELTPDQPVSDMVSLAVTAESAALDAVFVSNHFDNRDPFQVLGAIARHTDSVSLGPGVVNPYESHPVRLATQIATVSEVAPGRVVCGIGAGDRATLTKLGIEQDRPVSRTAEAIGIIRQLLGGETVNTRGIVSAQGARLSFEPTAVPIYVGAQGPTMLRMAGVEADGVLINGAHPVDYDHAIPHVRQGLSSREAPVDSFRTTGFVCTSLADDSDAAKHAATPPTAFITAGAPDQIIARHGIDTTRVERIRRALERGNHAEAYEAVTDQMRAAFCVAGTPERVKDRLIEIGAYVDALVIGSPLGPDRTRAIELLASITDDIDDAQVLPS